MKLLTAKNKKDLPVLYSQESKGLDAIVQVKFFDPQSSWTWYATEACAIVEQHEGSIDKALSDVKPEDKVLDIRFFGLVDGLEKELGYFSFNELKEYRGRFGLGIERDMHFTKKPLKDFM